MEEPRKIPTEDIAPVDRGDNEEIENIDGVISVSEEIHERKHHHEQEGFED